MLLIQRAIGNHLTPKAKTVKVQTECVNRTLVQYNPEIVKATKEAALPALLQREAKDNEIAAQKGLKPYTLLNVEFNEGADEKTGGYIGWYYVTLAVDGKICTHLETGYLTIICSEIFQYFRIGADHFALIHSCPPDVKSWTTFFTNKFEKEQKNKPYKVFSRFQIDLSLVGLNCLLYIILS